MFLFLSKLLPLFIYPLGLTCVLMVVALVSFWKRPRLAASAISLGLSVLWLGSNSLTANWLVQSLEFQNIPAGELPQAEAIVVLGGATKPALPPRPGVDLSEAGDRVLYAAQLYREGKAPRIILSGGRIRWLGTGKPESTDMATVIQTLGVPASALLQDSRSRNTYENALNVKQILDRQEIQGPVLLVTSALHMPRSLLIFKHLGIWAIAAPTDFRVTYADQQPASVPGMLIDLLPDPEGLQRTSRALKEYIGLVVYRLRGWL